MRTHPARLIAPNHIGAQQVFLTLCTANRKAVFIHPPIVEFVQLHFLHTAPTLGFEIPAYCFMPDHLHALVASSAPSADLHNFVRVAKQRTAFHFKARHGEALWQQSYFDRTLRENEDPFAVIRYIVDNPVRAGMVKSPEQYPFWGSQTYTRETILEYIRGPGPEGPGLRRSPRT
jgi:putative transposase